MSKDMYLVKQMIEILILSATGKKYYGKELETLDDLASVMNAFEIHQNRRKPITANYLRVAKCRIATLGLLQELAPDWEEIEKTHEDWFFCNAA